MGPAASEPCRRSEWLLHGRDTSGIQPNTRSRRDASRPKAGSPRFVIDDATARRQQSAEKVDTDNAFQETNIAELSKSGYVLTDTAQ
jgi:hypothetical protein